MIDKVLIKKLLNFFDFIKLIFITSFKIIVISILLYFLFSFLPNEGSDFCFTDYSSIGVESFYDNSNITNNKVSFTFIQSTFKNYIDWFINLIHGELGPISFDDPNPLSKDIFSKLMISTLMIFLGLMISFIIAIILLIISNNTFSNKYLVKPILSLSLFHILFTAFIIFTYFVKWGLSFHIGVALTISFGSGVLRDYYSLIKESYQRINNKDYVVFAENSGLNAFYFSFTEILINLITITLSRIPILFGGLIILEVYNSKLEGIGFLIWRSMQTAGEYPPSLHTVYSSSIIMIGILYYIFTFNDYIRFKLSPKENVK